MLDPEIWNAHIRTCSQCSTQAEQKSLCAKGRALLLQLVPDDQVKLDKQARIDASPLALVLPPRDERGPQKLGDPTMPNFETHPIPLTEVAPNAADVLLEKYAPAPALADPEDLHENHAPETEAIQGSGLDGQNPVYIVLSAAERAKGYVRPLRHTYTHDKCGVATTMGDALAQTYARDPNFYTSTFCVGSKCKAHFPVAEFKWDDGNVVGS